MRALRTSPFALVLAIVLPACDRSFSIASLRIDGKTTVAEATLREAAADCKTAEECAAEIEAWYFDNGYLTTNVEPTKTFVHKLTGGYSSLTVEEGARYTVSAVEIFETGATDELGDTAGLLALSEVRVGETFLQENVTRTYLAIDRRYEAAGHRDIQITPMTDLDIVQHTIKLSLEIDRTP